jgi:glycosyltransferase involved in cell wall biosynthesis
MKNLLFIVPSRGNAGTNSSLSCIYNIFKDRYNIKVVTMESKGNGSYEFLKEAYTPLFLDAYLQNYSNIKGLLKFVSFLIKIIKRLAFVLGLDIETKVFRYVAKQIERKWELDYIIGFQEGIAMNFAAQFKNPNKLTWIHCDYVRAFSESQNELNLYARFKKIVCVSNFTREQFISRYPSLTPQSTTIYNLLDEERILRLSCEPIEDSKFKNSDFTIVSMGRMDPIKRFALIPSIARKIKERNLKFNWYILGGPENDTYKEIEKLIQENEVGDSVILLGNKTNPYPYLKQSDLLVTTSCSEACPMIFNEAKLCGTPIVTSNFSSAHEFILEGINGYVCPVEKIEEKIIDLIITSKYHDLKKNCILQDLNQEKIKNQIANLFTL